MEISIRTTKVPNCSRPIDARVLASAHIACTSDISTFSTKRPNATLTSYMDMSFSQGTRTPSQGEYPVSGQNRYMLIETNGQKSAGKHSHHLIIRFFYLRSTDKMIGDYMTKLLYEAKFDGFHQQIIHLPVAAQLMMAAVLITVSLSFYFFIHRSFWATIFELYIIKVLTFIH